MLLRGPSPRLSHAVLEVFLQGGCGPSTGRTQQQKEEERALLGPQSDHHRGKLTPDEIRRSYTDCATRADLRATRLNKVRTSQSTPATSSRLVPPWECCGFRVAGSAAAFWSRRSHRLFVGSQEADSAAPGEGAAGEGIGHSAAIFSLQLLSWSRAHLFARQGRVSRLCVSCAVSGGGTAALGTAGNAKLARFGSSPQPQEEAPPWFNGAGAQGDDQGPLAG